MISLHVFKKIRDDLYLCSIKIESVAINITHQVTLNDDGIMLYERGDHAGLLNCICAMRSKSNRVFIAKIEKQIYCPLLIESSFHRKCASLFGSNYAPENIYKSINNRFTELKYKNELLESLAARTDITWPEKNKIFEMYMDNQRFYDFRLGVTFTIERAINNLALFVRGHISEPLHQKAIQPRR